MSTPINAANGASIGFRRGSGVTVAHREAALRKPLQTSGDAAEYREFVRLCRWDTTRSSNMNNAKFSATPVPKPVISKSYGGRARRTRWATPPHCSSRRTMPPVADRTGRGRKNEQYCDGDGGKRIA